MLKKLQKQGYKIIQLNNGKANPIGLEMVLAIRKELQETERDDSIKAIIWIGNTDGFFSVGLNLKELFLNNKKQMAVFLENWEAMVHELAAFPKPMVAAINGWSPAGGCVLAVTCDYRIMANDPKFLIGLNELAVGITIPEYIFQLYAFWVGKRKAYQNLMVAKLMSPQEAFDCHLVDEIVEMSEVLPRAEYYLQKLLRTPYQVVIDSKKAMRQELLERLEAAPKIAMEDKLMAWFAPNARSLMELVVKSLMK